jgi:2-dehydro-3-deoxy-D-arabinonate dehydratase
MRLAKYHAAQGEGVGVVDGEALIPLNLSGGQFRSLTDLLETEDPRAAVDLLLDPTTPRLRLDEVALLAPIDKHEVWAAGVTYQRSQAARMEESEGAARFYDLVYTAPRPELFFKATPDRVARPGGAVRIRRDSAWNVPEPELALVLNSRLELVGYTIGNDMSSRDIEGENPLYLPQAKVYDECCALGPWITLRGSMPPREETTIALAIHRGGAKVFAGETSVARMARTFEDLIGYLGREQTFRRGVVLLTGTGIVPEEGFTLAPDDVVEITIAGIGTLRNTVVRG